MSSEWQQLDGLAQAALVEQGEATPQELVEAAIARIEKMNPALNAVVTTMYDEAQDAVAAGVAEGPFQGVPFLLRCDSNLLSSASRNPGLLGVKRRALRRIASRAAGALGELVRQLPLVHLAIRSAARLRRRAGA